MDSIIELIEKELSEPYIVYTYRYFVNQWPSLCFLAYAPPSSSSSSPIPAAAAAKGEERGEEEGEGDGGRQEAVGVIVCKLDRHLKGSRLMRGYIAMISVKHSWRGRGLAKRLVGRALEEMVKNGAQEVVLETEADNIAALALYERLGFIREKRLHRFYLNGKLPSDTHGATMRIHIRRVSWVLMMQGNSVFVVLRSYRQRLIPTGIANTQINATANTPAHGSAPTNRSRSTALSSSSFTVGCIQGTRTRFNDLACESFSTNSQ